MIYIESKTIDCLLSFVIGLFVSFWLFVFMYETSDKRITAYKKAKFQCEQNLPRNQYCDVEFIAKPKEVKQ